MIRKTAASICYLILFSVLFPLQSQENKIDWESLPQLKDSGYGVSDIDKEPEKIGNLADFEYLKEDGFSHYLKSGNVDVTGIKRIEVNITNSSDLKAKNELYDGKMAFDGDIKTAWCEGVKGYGFKEWLKLDIKFTIDKRKNEYKDGVSIAFVIIHPGFGRSNDLFFKNNRLKSLLLLVTSKEICKDQKTNKMRVCKNTSIHRLKFQDINKYHLFRIEDPYAIASEFEIYMYIEDVYKGSKYDDTCISDIRFHY